MAMMRLEQYKEGWYFLHSPTSSVTRTLKTGTPTDMRFYDPGLSVWVVHESLLPLLGLADSKPGRQECPYRILYLTRGAPMPIVEAAWRTLAKEYHPDTGGDAESFKRIQEAYKQIKVQHEHSRSLSEKGSS